MSDTRIRYAFHGPPLNTCEIRAKYVPKYDTSSQRARAPYTTDRLTKAAFAAVGHFDVRVVGCVALELPALVLTTSVAADCAHRSGWHHVPRHESRATKARGFWREGGFARTHSVLHQGGQEPRVKYAY